MLHKYGCITVHHTPETNDTDCHTYCLRLEGAFIPCLIKQAI